MKQSMWKFVARSLALFLTLTLAMPAVRDPESAPSVRPEPVEGRTGMLRPRSAGLEERTSTLDALEAELRSGLEEWGPGEGIPANDLEIRLRVNEKIKTKYGFGPSGWSVVDHFLAGRLSLDEASRVLVGGDTKNLKVKNALGELRAAKLVFIMAWIGAKYYHPEWKKTNLGKRS